MKISDSPRCQRSHIPDFSTDLYHLRLLRDIANTPSFHFEDKVLHRSVKPTAMIGPWKQRAASLEKTFTDNC
jgi:hypothetical protein